MTKWINLIEHQTVQVEHPILKSQSMYEERFQRWFPEEVQAFSFWKGRIALYAILRAMEIGEGDEVILPGYTCVVVPNAIRFVGAEPIYVDIAVDEYNIDPHAVEGALSGKTRAIILQHTYGIPADLKAVQEIAKRNQLRIIEDCAHVFGGKWDGVPLGAFGDAAFFSSQWSKPYTTGLGGVAVTKDTEIARKLVTLKKQFKNPSWFARAKLGLQVSLYNNFFSSKRYWTAQDILHMLSKMKFFIPSSSDEELNGRMPPDYLWRMSNLQEREGVRKLAAIDGVNAHKRSLVSRYNELLAEAGWGKITSSEETVLLRYSLRVANKENLLEKAHQHQVEIGSWFETPLHPINLDLHSKFGYKLGSCPNAEMAARQTVNLPLHAQVTKNEVERIAGFLLEHAIPTG